MNQQDFSRILSETAYVRTGGSAEEKRCAEYLRDTCLAMGLNARIETFSVPNYSISEAKLTVDGIAYNCIGYANSGSSTVQAPLYYLDTGDSRSLKKCVGKIVLVDGSMGYWLYQDLLEHGALGFIVYYGNIRHDNRDLDRRELRGLSETDRRIPGVMIHVTDAIHLAETGGMAELTLIEETSTTDSWNVLVDLPGETDETIVFSAHYDSTSTSLGSYDNMSACIAQLYIAERLSKIPHHYSVRFLWCGSEERGLLGSKAYCAQHTDEHSRWLLNINLDMLGSTMGRFAGFAVNPQMFQFMDSFADEKDFGMSLTLGIRSSDSNSFMECGVPAVSFARYAPDCTATIHNRYDTPDVVNPNRLLQDSAFIADFTERLATTVPFPLERTIDEKVQNDLDVYFRRKRK